MDVDERELLLEIVDVADRLVSGDGLRVVDKETDDLLATLRDRLRNLNNLWAGAFENTYSPVRAKTCERCSVAFYFAQDVGGRWIPLEMDRIPAEGVLPAWRYVVTFGGFDSPQVRVQNDAKEVWVDHRQTCGANPDGPKYQIASYLRRWKVNVAHFRNLTDNVAGNLLALGDRLRSPE